MALSSFLNSIGVSLFRNLCDAGGDVLVSPLSISSSLWMAAAGTTNGSATQQEFSSILGTTAPELSLDDSVGISNSVWIRASIKSEYIERMRAWGAEVHALNSPDPIHINAWVKTKTHGKIESLMNKLDPLTVMVLVNTVFFKGIWKQPFDPLNTEDGSFKSFDKLLSCKMMYNKFKSAQYTETRRAQIVRLPHASGELFTTIILPKEEGRDPLRDIVTSLTPEFWSELHTKLQRTRPVEVRLPRFKLEFGADLSQSLKELGLPAAFDRDGGFLRMSDDPQVHISSIVHKVVLEVNEEGTVASAATAVTMATRSLPPPPASMIVDRPFIFIINDAEGAIYFLGRALSPIFTGISTDLPRLKSDL